MNMLFALLIALFITPGEFWESNKNYCLSKDDNPYLHFGTITSYDNFRMNGGSATDCEPIQMWLLSRHGTRNSENFNIMKQAINLRELILENSRSGNVKLCQEDLAAISNWSWDNDVEIERGHLNEQGRKELAEIAERYKMRYPKLLNVPYDPDLFYFKPTAVERVINSSKAFIKGLFGDTDVKIEKTQPGDDISPFFVCNAWLYNKEMFEQVQTQKRAFIDSAPVQKILGDISDRLGFPRSLTMSNILAMYSNCRFDKTRSPTKLSPWCAVFTKWELVLLEYYDEITTYYKFGPGNEVNRKLGCFPLKNMMENFAQTIHFNEVQKNLIGLFSHDVMLDMTLSALNFGKDQQPHTGNNYEDLLINRRYRTALNIGFASNIVAVLHDCRPEKERYKVQFFLNERPMQLEGCPDGLCTWTHLKEFLSFTKDCSLEFCNSYEVNTNYLIQDLE